MIVAFFASFLLLFVFKYLCAYRFVVSLLMRSEEKYDIYQQHQFTKPCRVCGVDESEKWGFVFCDSCDDGYHWKCIDLSLTQEQIEQLQCWICPPCVQLQQNTIIRDENKSQDCYKCKIPLNITTRFVKMVMTDLYGVQRIVKTPVPLPLIKNCRHCKNLFHSKKCFSRRFNSLNCGQCEQKIRSKGPKCHLQFIAYLKPEIQCIHEMGYIEIKHNTSTIQQQSISISYSRLSGIGLQVFQHSGNWQTICRMETSLFYALRSNNLHYCISQLYQNMQTMKLNKPTSNIYTPKQLSKIDEEVYEEFMFMTREGYIPPLEIKQDFQKGFYAVAAQYIPKLTLLCEYVGEVRTKRQTIAKHQDNDSIMSLIQTAFAETGLDIAPQKFANVSKFISGVPEHRKDLINVQTLNFCYRGRSHIIFFTIKPIENGMTLFIDYNAGIHQQFPTQNFSI